jgi:Na+-driven multidrug efflux pump
LLGKEFLKLSIPSSLMYVFANLMELINMAFVGHLGDPAKVAGVGLANVYINMVS